MHPNLLANIFPAVICLERAVIATLILPLRPLAAMEKRVGMYSAQSSTGVHMSLMRSRSHHGKTGVSTPPGWACVKVAPGTRSAKTRDTS